MSNVTSNNSGGTAPSAPKSSPPRRRRWPLILGGLFILLILLLLALPSLLCTGPGVAIIESQINSRIRGKVTIDQLSLGWFSPAGIQGLTVRDPAGNVVMAGVNVRTELSLIHLASNWKNLGTIKLTVQQATLQQSPAGLNLAQAFASRTPAVAGAAPATATAPAGPPAQQAAGSQLPAIDLKLTAAISQLTFRSPTGPQVRAKNTRMNLALNLKKNNQPVKVIFATQVGVAGKPSAKISADATLELFTNRRMRPVNKISGQTNLAIKGLDLAALQPVLNSAGIKISPTGELNLTLAYASLSGMAGKVHGNLTIDRCILAGAALKGDRANLGQVQLPIDITWDKTTFHIQQLGLTSAMGNLAVTGGGAIGAILPDPSAAENVGSASLQVSASAPLATIMTELRHTCQIPVGVNVSGGQTSFAANVTLQGPLPSGAKPSDPNGQVRRLPAADGTMKFKLSPLTLSATGHKRPHVLSIAANIGFDTMGKPLTAAVDMTVAHGHGLPAMLAVTANIHALKNRSLLPIAAMTGTVEVKARQFAYFREILRRVNAPLTMDGVLHGNILATITKPGEGTLAGKLVVKQLSLGGALLHGDSPQLGTCTVAMDGALAAGNLNVRHFSITAAPFSFSAAGHTTLHAIDAIRSGSANWGTTGLHTQMTLNAPLIAANLPHMLKLNGKGLHLKTGSINLTARLTSHGSSSSISAILRVSDLAGRIQDRQFQIAPLELTGLAGRAGNKWNPDRIRLIQGTTRTAPNIAIQVQRLKGRTGAFNTSVALNLSALAAQAGELVNLHGLSTKGRLKISLAIQHAFTRNILYDTSLHLTGFNFKSGATAAAASEKSLDLSATGTVAKSATGITAVDSRLVLATPEVNFTSRIQAANPHGHGWTVPVARIAIKNGSLAALEQLAAPFSPSLSKYRVAGNLAGSKINAAWVPGNVTISLCHLVAANLKVTGVGPAVQSGIFAERQATLDTRASLTTGKSTNIQVQSLVFSTADHTADLAISKPILIHMTPGTAAGVECPGLNLTADLTKVRPLLVAIGSLPADRILTGNLSLQSAVTTAGRKITVNLQAKVAGYQLATKGNASALPATNIAASIGGVADLKADTFTATQACLVSETAVSGSGSDSVDLADKNVACWSDQRPENLHLTVHYDLARLSELLGPFLPAGLTMAGKHAMVLAITGNLTPVSGLGKLRNLVIAPTALTFDTISIDGLTLGPGSVGFRENKGMIAIANSAIPANKGTLNLGGLINLNKSIPDYTASNLHLAEGININAPMGGTLLKFLPIAWGGGANGTGLMTLAGQFNLTLKTADLPLEYSALRKTGTFSGTISVIHLTSNSPLLGMIGNMASPLGFLGGGNMKMADSGIRPTDFNLKQGKIYYQHMKMVLTSFGLDFSGWVGLDNQIDQDLSITGAGLSVPIPLAITGTTSSPKLKLSGKPLKNIGKNIGNVIKKSGGSLIKNFFGN